MPSTQRAKGLLGRRRRAAGDSGDEGSAGSDAESLSDVSDASSRDGDEPDEHEGNIKGDAALLKNAALVQEIPSQISELPRAQSTHTEDNKIDEHGPQSAEFTTTADTQIMVNGIKDVQMSEKAVDYNANTTSEKSEQNSSGINGRSRQENIYKTDTKAIRGNYFMHDSRHLPGSVKGHDGVGRGRPFHSQNLHQFKTPVESQWTHDLHDTINQPKPHAQSASIANAIKPAAMTEGKRSGQHHQLANTNAESLNSSMSSILLGNVQVKIRLPHRTSFTTKIAPVTQRTCLPDNRPPLRRDRPVRIAIPKHQPRYLYPAQNRSFVFVPRSMRSDGQHKKGAYGHWSARTSLYGESHYSPSIVQSRRSSTVQDHSFSPVDSSTSKFYTLNHPVVRLPRSDEPNSLASSTGSLTATAPPYVVSLPQTPAFEQYMQAATMYQPTPHKSIAVNEIDSAAVRDYHERPLHPFENQVSANIYQNTSASLNPMVGTQQYATYSTNSTVLPSSAHIPDRAIHAQPFQPLHQTAYAGPMYGQYPSTNFYYPSNIPYFVPETTMAHNTNTSAINPTTLAHESNGMVYYVDPSQMQDFVPGAFLNRGSFIPQSNYNNIDATMPSQNRGDWYYPELSSNSMYYPQG